MPISAPIVDLAALIEAIPAPVNIENVQFTVQQHATFHFISDLEHIQDLIGQLDNRLAQLM